MLDEFLIPFVGRIDRVKKSFRVPGMNKHGNPQAAAFLPDRIQPRVIDPAACRPCPAPPTRNLSAASTRAPPAPPNRGFAPPSPLQTRDRRPCSNPTA